MRGVIDWGGLAVGSQGWALVQALAALPYYRDTNPGVVQQARVAIAAVLEDS